MFDKWRRWRAELFEARHPFPQDAWDEARARVPLLASLIDDDEATRLGHRAWRFAHAKRLTLHPTLAETTRFDLPARLVLAGQACLLTMNWQEHEHAEAFANVHEILVLPDAFSRRVEEMDEFGVMHEYEDERAGETSYQGPVVVSFADLMASGDWTGFNVLIHELAHKLDMGNASDIDGFPPLPRDIDPREWHRIFTAAWDDLQAQLARGSEPPIDDYAASHPGECYAVCCEYFFAAPDILAEAYPELYALLGQYFRQDPLARLQAGSQAQASSVSRPATSQSHNSDASS
ncbi:zinc-dependent peptidase [Litchfieldella xinjiangensis]|uniref:M90 family metallopeptidase n=1 Tax=Litchfieldella xinjiangensis TaxID=1166948 RepID=UPI0009DCEBA5|nr:M90 family metallopeptidase [Halomonas xinjiangensis]